MCEERIKAYPGRPSWRARERKEERREHVRQKAYSWESAEVIVGEAHELKDLMWL